MVVAWVGLKIGFSKCIFFFEEISSEGYIWWKLNKDTLTKQSWSFMKEKMSKNKWRSDHHFLFRVLLAGKRSEYLSYRHHSGVTSVSYAISVEDTQLRFKIDGVNVTPPFIVKLERDGRLKSKLFLMEEFDSTSDFF